MPPSVADLALQLERETEHRERALKYAHNMMEDLKTAFGEFRVSIGRMQGGFEQHIIDDQKTSKTIDLLYRDVKTVTRLVYIGLGGVLVLGALMAIVGERILTLLGHG